MLPLSHDEVVHGKGPLIARMPGDEWQRFANLRLLYACMYTHPGTKLLFMGCEFGQTREWNADDSLHWDLLQFKPHQGIQQWVKALNSAYKTLPALYERSFGSDGYQWIDHGDHNNSVLSFIRHGNSPGDELVIVINLTPRPHENYRIGAPMAGFYQLILNSDDPQYFGSGFPVAAHPNTQSAPSHGFSQSLSLNLPPLGMVIYRREA
jgi:1,4-alpha-glucan branching enzyme